MQPIRLPRRLGGKEATCQAEDTGSFPGLERSPGETHSGNITVHVAANESDMA